MENVEKNNNNNKKPIKAPCFISKMEASQVYDGDCSLSTLHSV